MPGVHPAGAGGYHEARALGWGVRGDWTLAETFRTVARVGEILEGRGQPFEVGGRMIALFLEEGEYYAIDDACPHRGAPLCDGIVFDKSVTCTWHGWRF